MTIHRRTKVVAHIPDAIVTQFDARFPKTAKNALVNACFHAALRYPELAWRLIRGYGESLTVLPDDWMPTVPEDTTP